MRPLAALSLAFGGLAGLSLVLAADSPKAALARCAVIAAADARLACYDDLARAQAAPPQRPAQVAAAPSAAAVAPTPPRTPSPPTSAAPAAAPVPATPAEGSFGLMPHPAPVQTPNAIQAVVRRVFTDPQGSVSVLLDNGQSWSLNELNAPVKPGDSVTLKRASLGSFLLVADHRSYRARRLK
jgi:hypothetical protein